MTPAGRINAYLKEKGSPLAGKGAVFVREGRKNGLDPMLLVAIAGAESDFGRYGPTAKIHNPFGWGPHIKFSSWEQAISTVARGLRKGYLDEGRKTIAEIGSKWAPSGAANDPTNLNSNWARNVGKFYAEIGGQGVASTPPRAVPVPAVGQASVPAFRPAPDLTGFALGNIAAIGAGGKAPSPLDMLTGLTTSLASQPLPQPSSIPNFGGLAPPPVATPAVGGGDWQKWVGKIETRTGPSKAHQQGILEFVGKVGRIAGTRLTPWGNESHSLTTVNGRPSAHGAGNAADIPATGAELIRLGQSALIAAGMPVAEARKQKGGLFNVGGKQVIFGVNGKQYGGNHLDHVHVGLRG